MNRREFLGVGAAASVVSMWGGRSSPARGTSDRDPILWLNWNENPAGLSLQAREAALDAVARAHRYPDLQRSELVAQLAERHGLAPENVVLGAGSTQILRAVVAAQAGTGKRLVMAEPTFEAVVRYQRPFSFEIHRVPLTDRYAHDLDRMRTEIGRSGSLVYICNPNNPTATLTPSAGIDAWIRDAPEHVMFIIDEAYHEYVEAPDYQSAVKWVSERPNVVVTRTFSKIYAMAGLRLGYGLAHLETAKRLREFLSVDNVNGVAIAAASAALDDANLIPGSRRTNAQARRIAVSCLEDLGLTHLPSHANFLMHQVEGNLHEYIGRMRERGIRVGRPFPPLLGYNRLTLGLPADMTRWADTLRDFRTRGWI